MSDQGSVVISDTSGSTWKNLGTGPRLWYMFLLVVMGGAWGLQFSMIKLATLNGYAEISVLFIALALISVVYVILLTFRRALFRVTRERFVFLVIISLLGYVLPLLAAVYAAPHVDAGVMTLLVSLTPVVTVATALILRTETVTIGRGAAVLTGAVAVVIVLLPEFEIPGNQVAWWMLLMLVVPLTYGVESIYVSAYWPEGLDVLQVGTGETVIALLMVLPMYLIWGDAPTSGPGIGPGEIGIVIFAISGVLDILLYFHIIQKTGGVFVSFGMFVSLFAGIVWGIVIFSEQHSYSVWGAVVLLLISLSLVLFDSGTRGAAKEGAS